MTSVRRRMLVGAALGALMLAGCGGDDEPAASGTSATTPSTAVAASSRQLPAPSAYTKNTLRINASDPVAVAATSALTMYPSTADDLRPEAVAIAGADDWRSILLASSFAAKPTGWPLLLTDGRTLPPASQAALETLAPEGASVMNNASAIRIGVSTEIPDLRTRRVTSSTPAGLARAVDRQLSNARGRPSPRVLIVNGNDPRSAAPAAAWAARSGDPILFVNTGEVPADTVAALETHDNPRIYVLGGSDLVSRFVISQLQRYGTVKRIQPAESAGGPADLAIAFARYSDLDFGWNYTTVGHGFVFAPTADPTSAMAASALSSGGTYGALLFVDRPDHVEATLRRYLLTVKPGYNDQNPPTQGYYNRGWMIGPERAITTETQGRIDSLLEIERTDNPNALGDTSPENQP